MFSVKVSRYTNMAGVTIQLGDSFCNQDLPLLPKVRKRLCDGSVNETNT